MILLFIFDKVLVSLDDMGIWEGPRYYRGCVHGNSDTTAPLYASYFKIATHVPKVNIFIAYIKNLH